MSRTRSTVLISLLVLLPVSAGLLFGLRGGSRSAAQSAPPAASGPSSTAQPPATPPQADAQATAPATPQPVPQAQPEPTTPPTAPPTTQPQPQPQPDPGILKVSPTIINLADNQWTAQFAVKNVGGGELAWFAVGVPTTLSLSETAGVLAPGQHVTVTVLVDHTKLAKGPFSLTLHVSANDTSQSVTVKGTKQITPVGPVGPGDLAAAKK